MQSCHNHISTISDNFRQTELSTIFGKKVMILLYFGAIGPSSWVRGSSPPSPPPPTTITTSANTSHPFTCVLPIESISSIVIVVVVVVVVLVVVLAVVVVGGGDRFDRFFLRLIIRQ